MLSGNKWSHPQGATANQSNKQAKQHLLPVWQGSMALFWHRDSPKITNWPDIPLVQPFTTVDRTRLYYTNSRCLTNGPLFLPNGMSDQWVVPSERLICWYLGFSGLSSLYSEMTQQTGQKSPRAIAEVLTVKPARLTFRQESMSSHEQLSRHSDSSLWALVSSCLKDVVPWGFPGQFQSLYETRSSISVTDFIWVLFNCFFTRDDPHWLKIHLRGEIHSLRWPVSSWVLGDLHDQSSSWTASWAPP